MLFIGVNNKGRQLGYINHIERQLQNSRVDVVLFLKKGVSMANRRMFCKDIVGSDTFKLMPLSSQALYFHLGMEADDRGYVDNAITLMRAIGANQGDLELLISKKFVLIRQNSLVLVKGWKINNYIQKDRFIETKYKDDLKNLFYDDNNSYTERTTDKPCVNTVYRLDTQDSIGKDSIGKSYKKEEESNLNKERKEKENDDFDEKEWTEMLERMGGK